MVLLKQNKHWYYWGKNLLGCETKFFVRLTQSDFFFFLLQAVVTVVSEIFKSTITHRAEIRFHITSLLSQQWDGLRALQSGPCEKSSPSFLSVLEEYRMERGTSRKKQIWEKGFKSYNASDCVNIRDKSTPHRVSIVHYQALCSQVLTLGSTKSPQFASVEFVLCGPEDSQLSLVSPGLAPTSRDRF